MASRSSPDPNPRRRRRHRAAEEDPHMRPDPRPGHLQRRRHTDRPGRFQVGQRVEHRRRAVEVRGEPAARVPIQQRIEPDVNLAREMRGDNVIGQSQIGPVRALPPATGDGRRPPRSSRACVLPSGCVHIPPGREQRTKEPDLVPRWRRRRDRARPLEEQPRLGRLRGTRLLRRHLQQPEQPHILRPQASQLPLKLCSSVGRLHTDTISRCRHHTRRAPSETRGAASPPIDLGLGRPPQLARGRPRTGTRDGNVGRR